MGLSHIAVRVATRKSIIAVIERFVRGTAVSQSRVARAEVAVTFDDGPHAGWTPQVLDALDRASMKATFFVVGRCVARHPELVLEARCRGHEIGTHLYSHDRRSVFDDRLFSDEVIKSKTQLESLLGEPIRWLRFPYGERGRQHPRKIKKTYGLEAVHWTYSSYDTKLRDSAEIVARVDAGLRPGVILLMHDALADEIDLQAPYIASREALLGALPRVGKLLRRRGLSAVTLSELLRAEGADRQ